LAGRSAATATKCPSDDSAVGRAAIVVALGAAFAGARLAVALGLAVGRVRLDVLGQVVAAHEAFVAHGTREPLLAGVRAKVTLQFVAARKPLPAEQPVAHKRSFPGVPPAKSNTILVFWT